MIKSEKIFQDSAKITISKKSHKEHFITVSGSGPVESDMILRGIVEQNGAQLLGKFAFGDRDATVKFAKAGTGKGIAVPLVGKEYGHAEMSSAQAFAVSGTPLYPIKIRGVECGYVFKDDFACYCRLSGITPDDPSLSHEKQTEIVFERMNEALEFAGFHFSDTVRTWFYLDKIYDWYGDFNRVRTAFFEKHRVFEKLVPASTGIGLANAFGTALIANLFAMRPKSVNFSATAVPSPMQNSAMKYRSSFNRAVELNSPEGRFLMISGTASIDKEGKSVFIGDTTRQINLTMEVVEALLRSRDMNWSNLVRGIVYFKNRKDVELFEQYVAEKEIPHFPLAVAYADICRDDLLFEIEVDAEKTK